MKQEYIKQIEDLGIEYNNSEQTLKLYSEDTSIFEIKPQIVVFPKNTEEVKKLISYVSDKDDLNITPRSAGTDMSGGPLNESIIMDMNKYFTDIISFGEKSVVVQPGMFYRDFEAETLKKNLLLPCYTASKDLNTVGGMVGNNSAGEKTLKYGKTEKFVKRLKAVLSDGNEYEFSKISKSELEKKMELQTYEGKIYRDIFSIIKNNLDLLKESKPKVSKNSAGYYIWNVYDEEAETFDMTKLIVGSQGTLAIVTEIEFDLVVPEPDSRMLVLFLQKKNMDKLPNVVNDILKHGPESFEAYDDHTFLILLKVLPSMIKRLGGNIFSLARDFWPDIKVILKGGVPKMVLLAEFTGKGDGDITKKALEAQSEANKHGISTHLTRNAKEVEKYWTIRRESFALLRKHVHGKKTAPFIEDIIVSPEHLPEFLPRLYKILDGYKLTYTVAGHIGSGNLHTIPLMDYKDPNFADIISDLSQKVYALVHEYGGSITAEHNDGLIRTPFLKQMYGEEVLQIFTDIKDIFDKDRKFNPKKKVGLEFEEMKKYIKQTNENADHSH